MAFTMFFHRVVSGVCFWEQKLEAANYKYVSTKHALAPNVNHLVLEPENTFECFLPCLENVDLNELDELDAKR